VSRNARKSAPGRAANYLTALHVDGRSYEWRLRHHWLVQPGGKGLKGRSYGVWLEGGKNRALILDFGFEVFGQDQHPAKTMEARELSSAIRLAIEAGWDPESRGRQFRYEVP
jgi:hypothetical protein